MNAVSDPFVVEHPSGKEIIDAIKKAGVEFIISVPDIVTSDGLLWPISKDPDLKLVRVCKEDEGVSICAAMSYSNTRALLLMQQTGLTVIDREGHERSIELTPLPFYDQEKRIPRGRATLEDLS